MMSRFVTAHIWSHRLKRKKGNALLLVLILFMVISILAVGVLAVSLGEHHMVLAEEKIDEAYYTARAVVEAANQWISTHYNARDEMALVIPDRDHLGISNVKVKNSTLDSKPYTLNIWRDTEDPDLIFITATATFEGFSASAKMSLQETISGYALFEDAIYSRGPMAPKTAGSSNEVNGSVSTGAAFTPGVDDPDDNPIPDNLNVTGTKTYNKQYVFEDLLPDSSIDLGLYQDNVTLNDGEFINNAASGNLNAWYGTLRIDRDAYITNTDASGNAVDVHILIDNFYIEDSAIIHPTSKDGGRVFIYVKEYISCHKKFGVGVGDTGTDDINPRTYLICSGLGDIDFSGNPFMNLYLYGPHVDVAYGGTTVYNGAIIANIYEWNGNITVTYRPPDLEGSPFEWLNQAQRKVSIVSQTWFRD